jgi:hypothetical protein
MLDPDLFKMPQPWLQVYRVHMAELLNSPFLISCSITFFSILISTVLTPASWFFRTQDYYIHLFLQRIFVLLLFFLLLRNRHVVPLVIFISRTAVNEKPHIMTYQYHASANNFTVFCLIVRHKSRTKSSQKYKYGHYH